MTDREVLETMIEHKEADEARLKRDLEMFRNEIKKTELKIECVRQEINLLRAI